MVQCHATNALGIVPKFGSGHSSFLDGKLFCISLLKTILQFHYETCTFAYVVIIIDYAHYGS